MLKLIACTFLFNFLSRLINNQVKCFYMQFVGENVNCHQQRLMSQIEAPWAILDSQ